MNEMLPAQTSRPGAVKAQAKPGALARLSRNLRITSPRDAQLRYLSQSVRLEEAVNPHLIRLTVVLVSLAVGLFIVWAAVTDVDEVARGPGEVIPVGYERVVQHLDGGIVGAILIKEGEYVTKGQPLLELEATGLDQDLAMVRERMRSLGLQAERFRAFLDGRQPDFSAFGPATDTRIAAQQSIFDSMIKARDEQRRVLAEQLEQKRLTIGIIEANRKAAESSLNYNQDLLTRRKTLFDKGLIAYSQMASIENEVNKLNASIAGLVEESARAEGEVREYNERLAASSSTQREAVYSQLHTIETDLVQNTELVRKIEARVERLIVRAPLNGVVKGVNVNTLGAVVQPGQSIISLVPLDEPLIVQSHIAPSDIGHVKLGQPVQLKISAYNFARYGWLSGTLTFISANTFIDGSGERYYRARISLDQRYVGNNPQRNPILPGMTATCEIITGKKTILAYLMKPIHLALSTAFSER